MMVRQGDGGGKGHGVDSAMLNPVRSARAGVQVLSNGIGQFWEGRPGRFLRLEQVVGICLCRTCVW